jgi:hypothetical protein
VGSRDQRAGAGRVNRGHDRSVCSVVSLTCLGSAYLWDKPEPLAYGYFAAEASFLLAAVASAVRLIRLRGSRAMWDAKVEAPFGPAASASQELLSRYRKIC